MNKKEQQLLNALNLNKIDESVKSIHSLKINGTNECIIPLFNFWRKSTNEDINLEIHNFFCSLSDSSSKPEIITILTTEKNPIFREKVLNSMWNSKNDYSDYLPVLVKIAVEGNYLESLECLTIIENLMGPISEEDILESQLFLKVYFEKSAQNEQKTILIQEIASILRSMEDNLTDL